MTTGWPARDGNVPYPRTSLCLSDGGRRLDAVERDRECKHERIEREG